MVHRSVSHARRAEHLDITLVELLTLSLAVLNGLMYFLWWHKPLDVRCPVRVYLLDKLDEPNEAVYSENLEFLSLFHLFLQRHGPHHTPVSLK